MNISRAAATFVVGISLFVGASYAQTMRPEAESPVGAAAAVREEASRIAEQISVPALAALPAAPVGAAEEIAKLKKANGVHAPRIQSGFSRPLQARVITLGGVSAMSTRPGAGEIVRRADNGDVVWSTHVTVEGAFALRVGLTDVELPAGTKLWVYAPGQPSRFFSPDPLVPDHSLWTPPVGGDTIYLEIRLPAASVAEQPARFTVARVAEGFKLDSNGQPMLDHTATTEALSCNVDTACLSDSYFATLAGGYDPRRAAAYLEFMDDGGWYMCSGGLIADRPSGTPPYLLTANHCFSTQAAASTLYAAFDYRSSGCFTPATNPYISYTYGATLLQTSYASDFTFVRLNQTPPVGRVYLGWIGSSYFLSSGSRLYRISHPSGGPQSLSESTTSSPRYGCLPSSTFLYSRPAYGAPEGGSSGAPAFMNSGQVVGQLFGKCYSGYDDDCDYTTYDTVDGRFTSTYSSIYPWIDPVPSGIVATASASAVQVSWVGVPGIDLYELDRADGTGGFLKVQLVNGTSWTDTNVMPGKVYRYCVRSASPDWSTSLCSVPDLVTTVTFTDDPLVAQSTIVKAVHLEELRTAVNLVRGAAGLTAATFTGSAPPGTTVTAAQILELRTALDAARSRLSLPALSYTDTYLTGVPVKAIHFQQLRNGMK